MTIEFEGTFETSAPGETEALGERVGREMTGGEVVVLVGELGTGKTAFIRGMARGMNVADPGAVRSPSYTLVIRYPGPRPLLHMDAYFMKSLEDLDLCTMEDALERRDTVAIEWGDRVAERLPDPAIVVRIEHQGLGKRRIRIAWETGARRRREQDSNQKDLEDPAASK